MPADPWKLVGTTVASRYRVDAIVAEGGSCRVYRATDREGGAQVALKVLKPPVDEASNGVLTLTEEYVRERDVLARVEHPVIVRGLGHGEMDLSHGRRTVYLALEWVEGPGLDRWLQARGALAPGEALALLSPVFEALGAVHRAGIVHRDIKPANLVVQDTPDGPRLRLLDFGVAKLMQPHETLGSQTVLTLSHAPSFSTAYAAPEQVSGALTGPWTDVHAMGLLVTEVLIGRRAYEGANVGALLLQILSPERPTPHQHGVDLGPLEPVLARSVALRPQSRFGDMGAFLEALRAAVAERANEPSTGARTANMPAVPKPAAEPEEEPEVKPDVKPEGGAPVSRKKKKEKGVALQLAVGVGIGMLLAIAVVVIFMR